MKLQVTFRNFDHTPALDELITKKSSKLKKYLQTNATVAWNCFIDSSDQVCEVNISGFQGPDIQATAKSDSLYKSIDLVIEKLEKQLRRKNEVVNMKIHGRTKPRFETVQGAS